VDDAGIWIVGEVLDESTPKPMLAIAFPMKTGAAATVPGFIPTTYTVGKQAKIKVPAGTYNAWKVEITDTMNSPGAVWIAPGVGVVQIQLPGGRIDQLTKLAPTRK